MKEYAIITGVALLAILAVFWVVSTQVAKTPAIEEGGGATNGTSTVPVEHVEQTGQPSSVPSAAPPPSAPAPSAPATGGATVPETTVLEQTAVTWAGTPITVEFDANSASPNVISIKRYETATLILKARGTVPAEGIRFLASQSAGGAPGPIKPGESQTVTVRPARSFFYSGRGPDNKTAYPVIIRINVYY